MKPHKCHWPECRKEVPPRLWGCNQHWFMLPAVLRGRIQRAYVPGQEWTKQPSPAYVDAAKKVRKWINEHQDLNQQGDNNVRRNNK